MHLVPGSASEPGTSATLSIADVLPLQGESPRSFGWSPFIPWPAVSSNPLTTAPLFRRFLPLLLLLCLANSLQAQRPPDSRGREFWACFMPNLGNDNNLNPRLRFFISSLTPTQVHITYTATGQVYNVSIPTPNATVTVDVTSIFGGGIELADVDLSALDITKSGAISKRSFHITADDEISLYGVGIRMYSADAFLGLPQDVLGTRHVVLAWPNGFLTDHYDTPSQFAVVATHDSTVLTITPPDNTGIDGQLLPVYTVYLNTGQVFLAQTSLDDNYDLTGAQVESNWPVALFSGCKRTSVPQQPTTSRDVLVEQLPPIDAWGRESLVTPVEQVPGPTPSSSVFRVMAPFNNTQLIITTATKVDTYLIVTPGYREFPINGPAKVTANKSILVAHYEHSSALSGGGDLRDGDPFMMLIPPAEQFDTSYTFQSVVDPEFGSDLHYINVVIPENATGTVQLDGLPVIATWRTIPGSTFRYTSIHVMPGSHQIRADSSFGLYVYGYGPANSYGYPGGLLFRRLIRDYDPPRLQSTDTCSGMALLALDDRISDLGIVTCESLPTSENVSVTVRPFALGADTVRVLAQLIDPYQDGLVALRVVDSAGSELTKTVAIPGFTVQVVDTASNTTPTQLEPLIHYNDGEVCRSITLRNYGKFTQTITRTTLLPGAPMGNIKTTLPITLYPGKDTTIEVCFQMTGDTLFPAHLTVAGSCIERNVATVIIENRIDTTAPHDSLASPSCSEDIVLMVDDGGRGSGIASVGVDAIVNGSARVADNLASVPLRRSASVLLHRDDPRQDLIYRLVVIDGTGNVRVMEDTLGGFTVSTTDPLGTPVSLAVGTPRTVDTFALGLERCDTVMVVNNGLRPLVISGGRARGNIAVSMPPSQFPLVVPPGEKRAATVCASGAIAGILIDTLDLFDECGHFESIEYNGEVNVNVLDGVTLGNCTIPLALTITASGKRTVFVAASPTREALHLFLGSTENSPVAVELVALDGALSGSALQLGTIGATIQSATLPLGTTPAGLYLCRLRTIDGSILGTQQVIVVR